MALTVALGSVFGPRSAPVAVQTGDVIGMSSSGPVVLSEIIGEPATPRRETETAAGAVQEVDDTPAATTTTVHVHETTTTTHVHAPVQAAVHDEEPHVHAEAHEHPEPEPTTTTTTAPPPEYAYDDPRSTQVWYDLAGCEAGGDWSADTGNGYYGGLQFSLGTWERVGGTGYPHHHDRATQIEMGRRLQAQDGWDAWPHCAEKLGLS